MIQVADQLFATDEFTGPPSSNNPNELVQQVIAWHDNATLLYFQIWESGLGGILRYTFPLAQNQILILDWHVRPVEFAGAFGAPVSPAFSWAFQATPTIYGGDLGLGVGYVSWRLINESE